MKWSKIAESLRNTGLEELRKTMKTFSQDGWYLANILTQGLLNAKQEC
jgi:hypothetical protein